MNSKLAALIEDWEHAKQDGVQKALLADIIEDEQNVKGERKFTSLPGIVKLIRESLADFDAHQKIIVFDMLYHISMEIDRTRLSQTFYLCLFLQNKICQQIVSEGVVALHVEYQKICFRRWIAVCLDANIDRMSKTFFLENGINPEDEIYTILFSYREGVMGSDDTGKFNLYLEEIENWFLKRYALTTAVRINTAVSPDSKIKNHMAKNLPAAYILFNITLILPIIILSSVDKQAAGVFLFFPLTVFPAVLCFYYFPFGASSVFKLLLPRLIAALMVGFIPIVLTGELWQWLGGLGPGTAASISCSAIIISFIYLYIEISNAVRKKVFSRAFNLLLHGMMVAFYLGYLVDLVFTDFYFSVYFPHSSHSSAIHLPVIFTFSPLALLFGIFVQIIWEDKPITHPL